MLEVLLVINFIITIGLLFMLIRLDQNAVKNFKDAADIFARHEHAIREIVEYITKPEAQTIIFKEDRSKLH